MIGYKAKELKYILTSSTIYRRIETDTSTEKESVPLEIVPIHNADFIVTEHSGSPRKW